MAETVDVPAKNHLPVCRLCRQRVQHRARQMFDNHRQHVSHKCPHGRKCEAGRKGLISQTLTSGCAECRAQLEVHVHSYVTGPKANRGEGSKITHSHVGGSHSHRSDTGPAQFVIDKDDWAHRTGLRGGGRKKFTSKASGPQLAVLP